MQEGGNWKMEIGKWKLAVDLTSLHFPISSFLNPES
jgi:hypothetical protein